MAFGQLRIEEMFAFVVVDNDGTEGIVGMPGPNGVVPMVGADMARVDQLAPVAKALATAIGKAVEVIKFTQRTNVRIIKPGKASIRREAPRLEDQVERVAPAHTRREVEMFDEPMAVEAGQVHGVVVAPAIGPDGAPAVGLVLIAEDGTELPPVVVVGPTAKDIGPLCADAYEKAKQAAN